MGRLHGLQLLLAAGALVPGTAQAQAQSGAQSQTFQVQVQFPPPAERKPVPFELVRNHLFFKARVEGREVWAILDNGLTQTAVDAAFARSAGVKVGPPIGHALTMSGSLERSIATGVRIEIPGQIDLRPPVSVLDLSAVSKLFGRPVSLVAGKDFFDYLAFFISPTNGSFQLAPSGTMHVPPDTPHLDLKNDQPQLDILIHGKAAVVTVDLGSNDAISLSEAAWDRLALSDLPTVPNSSVGGDGRAAATRQAAVDVVIGPISSNDIPVIIGPVLPGNADGVLGMGFFSRFDFVIDVKARSIWLSLAARPGTGSAK